MIGLLPYCIPAYPVCLSPSGLVPSFGLNCFSGFAFIDSRLAKIFEISLCHNPGDKHILSSWIEWYARRFIHANVLVLSSSNILIKSFRLISFDNVQSSSR